MLKLTPEVAQAVVNLRVSQDWRIFFEWFVGAGESWNQVLIDTNDSDTRVIAAGMTRAVREVVSAVNAAPEILRAMKHDG